jgi:tetratricopeptide (TPR) repeat protein
VEAITALYLAGDAAAAESAAREALTASAGDTAAEAVFGALAGGGQAPEAVFKLNQDRPETWATACLGLFAREAAVKPRSKLDPPIMEYLIQNYLLNLPQLKSPSATRWRDAAPRWLEWVASGFKDHQGMTEPVFTTATPAAGHAPDTGPDIAAITAGELAALRAGYARRPKPAGLDFERAEVVAYLKGLPTVADREAELARYNYIKGFKDQLVRIFERNHYEGLIKIKKRQERGVVCMANNDILMVKRSARAKKSQRVRWKDLEFSQYSDFISYYASMRLKIDAPNTTESDRMAEAAEDYLRLAVLCDWFDRYGEAIEYARKALALRPEIKDQANTLFFGH